MHAPVVSAADVSDGGLARHQRLRAAKVAQLQDVRAGVNLKQGGRETEAFTKTARYNAMGANR